MERKITLIFPNYSLTPVQQKWSEKSLRLIPYFDKLFDWEENPPEEIEMEVDPMVFSKLMKILLTRNFESELEALADYLCVDITENFTSMNEKISKTNKKSETFIKDIHLDRDNTVMEIDISKFAEIKDVTIQSSGKRIDIANTCKIEVGDVDFIMEGFRKLDKNIISFINQKIKEDNLKKIKFKFDTTNTRNFEVNFKIMINYIRLF